MERSTISIKTSPTSQSIDNKKSGSSELIKNPSQIDQVSIPFYYKLIKKLQETFNNKKKSISPDFRNFFSNLQALKYSNLNSAISKIQKLNLLDFLTDFQYLSLETFAAVDSPKSAEVVNIEERAKISEKVKKLIINSSSFKISKYGLHLDTIEKKSTEELVLLGKFLIVQDDSIRLVPRCVVCLQKLSVMAMSGIILECSHTICFNCHLDTNVLYCPLDHSSLMTKNYLEKPADEDFLACQGNHCLINVNQIIYKLRCGHVSCANCLRSSQFCKKCFELINPFTVKEQKIFMEFISQNQLVCSKHLKKAEGIEKNLLVWFCEDCIFENKIYFSDVPCYNFIDSVLNKTFSDLFLFESVKSFNFPLKFLKKCVFFKILSLDEKAKVLRLLLLFLTNNKKFEDVTQEVFLYSKTYPRCPSSLKILLIESPVFIKIIPQQHFWLSGLRIGQMYVKSEKVLDFLLVSFDMIKFQITLNQIPVYEELRPACHSDNSAHSVQISLFQSVLMSPNHEYEMVFHLPRGHYFHGVPFSKLSYSNLFQLRAPSNKSFPSPVLLSLTLSNLSF